MTRAMHENDWKVINDVAERTAEHLLFAQAYKYNGQVETLIEDTMILTLEKLAPELLLRNTMIGLRDVVMGAVYETNVSYFAARRVTA